MACEVASIKRDTDAIIGQLHDGPYLPHRFDLWTIDLSPSPVPAPIQSMHCNPNPSLPTTVAPCLAPTHLHPSQSPRTADLLGGLQHPGFRRLWARHLKEPEVELTFLFEKLSTFLTEDQGMDPTRVQALLGQSTSAWATPPEPLGL